MGETDALPRRFTVVIDNREKPHNRLFTEGCAPEEHDPIVAYRCGTLTTGDYAIQECPKLVCIEKKQDGKELYTNLVHAKDRTARLFDRMKEFQHRWIVFQQTYEEFCDKRSWAGVKNPETAMKVVESWLMSLSAQGIYFIFAGDQAERWVRRVLTKKYDEERKRARAERK